MNKSEHWEQVYGGGLPNEKSWYTPRLGTSLRLIESVAGQKSAAIIDIGAGASTLVDDLLVQGYSSVTALDLSAAALGQSKDRLGDRAHSVNWIEGDVLTVTFPAAAYDVWHDRAVFHFLINRSDRIAYLQKAHRSIKGNGHLILGVFSKDGPTRCSGLDVVRFGVMELVLECEETFQLIDNCIELHQTPTGAIQPFLWCTFAPIH